jgi:hypothetical protein
MGGGRCRRGVGGRRGVDGEASRGTTLRPEDGEERRRSREEEDGRPLQRLICRFNFHAFKFVPEVQQAGSLLVQRLRRVNSMQTETDKQLLGNMFDPVFAVNHAADSALNR